MIILARLCPADFRSYDGSYLIFLPSDLRAVEVYAFKSIKLSLLLLS